MDAPAAQAAVRLWRGRAAPETVGGEAHGTVRQLIIPQSLAVRGHLDASTDGDRGDQGIFLALRHGVVVFHRLPMSFRRRDRVLQQAAARGPTVRSHTGGRGVLVPMSDQRACHREEAPAGQFETGRR